MSERTTYPPAVPCWVDTLQPDPASALRFYGALFEWEFTSPGGMPGDPPGEYFLARVRGRDVAAVGSQPADAPCSWNTYVSVESADRLAQVALDAGGTVVSGPVDAPPAGRLVVLADPSGGVICGWEPQTRTGAQLVNEPSAWAMSLLHTHDPDRSRRFYGEVFGWQSEAFAPGIELFRRPGYVGGEAQQPVPRDVVAAMAQADEQQVPAHWSVDFWVRDLDAATDTTTQLGGRVLALPSASAGMRQAVIADPQGATLSLTQAPGIH